MQPPQGRRPEHLDFLPLHRRQAVFTLVCSVGDASFSDAMSNGFSELDSFKSSKAACVRVVCLVCGDINGDPVASERASLLCHIPSSKADICIGSA